MITENIVERQAIELIDAWGEKHTVKVNKATTNFEEAIKGVGYMRKVYHLRSWE